MLTLLPLSSKRGSLQAEVAKASSLNGLMIFLERADGLKRNSRPRSKLTREWDSPTHKVDCFKGLVGLEIEWNNKDPFFDRDLNNFRLLFDLRVIDVGVIVTRATHLQEIFRNLGKKVSDKYGSSTTHMDKLVPRLEGGGGGGCPILVFGITHGKNTSKTPLR